MYLPLLTHADVIKLFIANNFLLMLYKHMALIQNSMNYSSIKKCSLLTENNLNYFFKGFIIVQRH